MAGTNKIVISKYSIELHQYIGTALCGQYIRNRLKRSNIFNHKLMGLKRISSSTLLSSGALKDEVFPVLEALGVELEKMHPTVYTNVSRQLGYPSYDSEQQVFEAMTKVAREMLRASECKWTKIASIYAVAGGIAVDCVKQGKPEFVHMVQRGINAILKTYLARWIHNNGGWAGLVLKYRPEPKETQPQTSYGGIIFGIVSVILAILCYVFILAINFILL